MSNKQTNIFLIGWSLMIIGSILYIARYDLGLKKPNFKAGDCVARDLSNEFEPYVIKTLIVKVGKKQYQTLDYATNDDMRNLRYSSLSHETIEYFDGDVKKIDCPQFLEVK